MHRFFVSPSTLAQQPVTLTGAQAHQARRVLRLRPDDRVVLLDDRGWAYEAVLIGYGKDDARFRVINRWAATGEPGTHLALYQAVLKGERFEWVLQKGTELGVSRFVPIVCERNVVANLESIEAKRLRWQAIIQEAAEQSGRGRLPELAPALSFTDAVQLAGGDGRQHEELLRLIPWEGAAENGLRDVLARCNLKGVTRIQVFIGPEGGFTEREIHLSRQHGVQPVSLGPRILRAETAGIMAAAAILFAAGDLEPVEGQYVGGTDQTAP